ncbi:MAG: phage minor capsid protein [Candidatus Limiplasma sp.]|nr:phage minor capsid protein [Candidatus Limiplasma sp.]
MLTPDFLDGIAEPLVELWAKVERDIIADIVRRLIQADYLTPSAKWQVVKARELGTTQAEVARRVARGSARSEGTVKRLVENASAESLGVSAAQFRKAGLDTAPLEGSAAMQRIIATGVKQTNGLMRNITRTLATTASKAFENCLDEAWLQVSSGAFSLGQALRTLVRDLAGQGITKVAYPSGHADTTDVAARRAVITGVNHTAGEIQLQAAKDMDTDLVQVSSHPGARPSHAVWQGGIYSISGKSDKYKPFLETTGYGTGPGLCGWNCRHSFYPFVEGVSEPSFDRDPSQTQYGKSNDQMYEESQRQRELERRIRASKRECTALDAARDASKDPAERANFEAEFAKASKLLKQREAKLNTFCEDTGRKKLVDRVQVEGYNRSVSGKVVAVNKPEMKRSAARDAIRPLVGKNHTVHIPPQAINISELSYDAAHVNDERMRGITAEEAKSFIDNAVVSIGVWGSYERYISEAGAAYVNLDKSIIRTAFRSADYTDANKKILEEVKKYGI